MNRPLALIEGDLALPNARLLGGLPPPFGLRRHSERVAERGRPQRGAAGGAQRSLLDAVQRGTSSTQQVSFSSGAKHVFLYRLPEKRDDSLRFDAQLAEARRYLDMGKVRPRSSRSDHVVGAVIFLGCSMALAWLLSTCTTGSTGGATVVATTPVPVKREKESGTPRHESAQPVQRREPMKSAEPSLMLSQRAEPLTAGAAPRNFADTQPQHAKAADAVNVTQSTRHTQATPRAHVADLSRTQLDKRLAASRTIPSLARPEMSKQPEWTTRPASSVNESAERAALLDWAARQRTANIAMHAAASVTASTTSRPMVSTTGDTDWNARMSQRRITDNPDAFRP